MFKVHLSSEWLQGLEKRLHRLQPHADFRVFLTMELNANVSIPASLISLSRVITFELPSGVPSSLERSFTNVMTPARANAAPVERCRVQFLVAFLHAVVLERLRYAPVGWTKKYDFSDADQSCAFDMVSTWIDQVSLNGQVRNVNPESIPWDALRELLTLVYGDRIDNEFDRKILRSVVDQLFQSASFNANFQMNGCNPDSLPAPADARDREQFLSWVTSLPSGGKPGWVGHPNVYVPN